MPHPRKQVAEVDLDGDMTLDHNKHDLPVRVIVYQEMVEGSPGLYDQRSEVGLVRKDDWELIISAPQPVRFRLQLADGSELDGRFEGQVLAPSPRHPVHLTLTPAWVEAHLPR